MRMADMQMFLHCESSLSQHFQPRLISSTLRLFLICISSQKAKLCVWEAQRGSVFFGLAELLFLISMVSICLLDARWSLLLSIFSSFPSLK